MEMYKYGQFLKNNATEIKFIVEILLCENLIGYNFEIDEDFKTHNTNKHNLISDPSNSQLKESESHGLIHVKNTRTSMTMHLEYHDQENRKYYLLSLDDKESLDAKLQDTILDLTDGYLYITIDVSNETPSVSATLVDDDEKKQNANYFNVTELSNDELLVLGIDGEKIVNDILSLSK
jgi:hypothetical protein